MKLRLYSFMASVLMASSMASAQVSQMNDSVTERMSNYLLGSDREVKTTEPLADKSYLPFGAEYANISIGSDIKTEKHTNVSGSDTWLGHDTLDPGFDYCYMLSKGVTGYPNDAGVVYYAYFSKSQFKIVKYNVLKEQVMLASELMSYSDDEVKDFTETTSLPKLRHRCADIFTGYVANDTRRNEVFQSFVDLNNIDYNADGTSDLCLMLGNTLYVFNGQDLKVMHKQKMTDENRISPSSVVYDFNGDGINDYLYMSTFIPTGGIALSAVEGGLLLSNRDTQGNVSFNFSKKTMNIKDLIEHKFGCWRTTISMSIVYPEGKYNAPKLAVATTDLSSGPRDDWGKYNDPDFEMQLTMLDFSPEKLCTTESDWYTPIGNERYWKICESVDEGTFSCRYYRQRPYLFGRPALGAAFSQGYDKPQRILWMNKIVTYNTQSKAFDTEFSIADRHADVCSESTYGRFDRIVGGQVAVINGCYAEEAKQGVESFVVMVAGSKDRTDIGTMVDDYDWEDVNYYVTAINPSMTNLGYWGYWPSSKSVLCYKPLSVTSTSADKGMQVELVDKRVVASTPIINHVLSAAPYEAGNVKYTGKTTVNFGDDDNYGFQINASSFGAYADESLGMCNFLKAATSHSEAEAWNNVKGNTISRKEFSSVDNVTGQDYVLYNYFPVDRFTYRISSCPSAPDLVGKEFYLVKSHDNSMYLDGMTVDEFNKLVEGSSCPQITEDVLRHTAGRIDSYVSGYNDSDSIMAAYGIDRTDCLGISDNIERATLNEDESVTAEYGQYLYIDENEPFSFSSAVRFAPGMKEWAFDNDGNAAFDWTQYTTLNRNSSVTCTLPMAENNPTYNGTYRMVWYKYTAKDAEGKPAQTFMVVNYYVASNGNEYLAKGNIDSFDTTDIDGIDDDKTIESVKYFDTTGREIAQPTQGMYMKVITYTDGSHDTKKLMAR